MQGYKREKAYIASQGTLVLDIIGGTSKPTLGTPNLSFVGRSGDFVYRAIGMRRPDFRPYSGCVHFLLAVPQPIALANNYLTPQFSGSGYDLRIVSDCSCQLLKWT